MPILYLHYYPVASTDIWPCIWHRSRTWVITLWMTILKYAIIKPSNHPYRFPFFRIRWDMEEHPTINSFSGKNTKWLQRTNYDVFNRYPTGYNRKGMTNLGIIHWKWKMKFVQTNEHHPAMSLDFDSGWYSISFFHCTVTKVINIYICIFWFIRDDVHCKPR